MTNFVPSAHRYLVKRDDIQKVSEGGVLLPDNVGDTPTQGDVLAVPFESTATDVKVGDKVVFGTYSGMNIEIDGKKLLILKDDDILGVIR